MHRSPGVVSPTISGMLRFLTAGESHGPGLTTIVEGLPAGLAVDPEALSDELARRRLGFGRGPRMKLERDELEILGGVRFGLTLGGPVSVLIRNTEWDKWSEEMSPLPGEARRPATTPRPGHADLAGMQKYDTRDARDILERASARDTAARTVAGTLAQTLLAAVDLSVHPHVVASGSANTTPGATPTLDDLPLIAESPVRAFGSEGTVAMVAAIEAAKADRDTLGGVVEVVAHGVMPGLGSHVHYDRRLDARLAGALMSIQAIKGVEIGDGFVTAARRGSEAHDEIRYDDGFVRDTNRAGGLEGGMSMGGVIRARAAMKPLSNLMRALQTVDVDTKQPEQAIRERSDVCAVPAAGVVAEQMVAIVLAQEVQRKFGGDTVNDLVAAVDYYRARLARF